MTSDCELLDAASSNDFSRPKIASGVIPPLTEFKDIPLAAVDSDIAKQFCVDLYHPEERFSEAFYPYWREKMNMSEADARKATDEELALYLSGMLDNLSDPNFHTLGFMTDHKAHPVYTPVGLYGFRELKAHSAGQKLIESMSLSGALSRYDGKLAIAHSLSALNGYRGRNLLKLMFLKIALAAVKGGYQHIFFFMSDYRLEGVYQRFGLDFPKDLTFLDSKHLVGCYSLTDVHLKDIETTAKEFNISIESI